SLNLTVAFCAVVLWRSFNPRHPSGGLRNSGPRLLPSTLALEIRDTAGLLTNSGFERFLGREHFGARLGEIVGKAHNLAFGRLCNRIVGALANWVVWRKLQVLDIGADHDGALIGGEIPV